MYSLEGSCPTLADLSIYSSLTNNFFRLMKSDLDLLYRAERCLYQEVRVL